MEMYDLLQCIERALDKFGSNAKQATYWTMMTKEGISWDNILTNPDPLMRVLAEIFGEDGSKLVEREMVKEIKREFSLENPSRTYTLSDALEIARKSLTGMSENQIVSRV
ncbi:MAG: hypothetical protein OK457_09965 [Thaumarchaeota archaeon]|nr:hypothetical protein [Nitrososphaerota archaeon]